MLNKEAEKQNFIGMMQVVIPMYQQAVQTAMAVEQMPPESAGRETAVATYSAIVELITRLLEKFDVQNPKEYIGNMQAVADGLTGQQPQVGAEAGGMGMPALPLSPFPMQMPLDPLAAPVFGLGV
jgi:hypothetical protein